MGYLFSVFIDEIYVWHFLCPVFMSPPQVYKRRLSIPPKPIPCVAAIRVITLLLMQEL